MLQLEPFYVPMQVYVHNASLLLNSSKIQLYILILCLAPWFVALLGESLIKLV